MGRYKQDFNGKGSLKCNQILINEYRELLNKEIIDTIGIERNEVIEWVSPLKDDYAEYRDEDFLKQLGIIDLKIKLHEFWPKKGPQWDALGKTDNGKVFLVEAKANITEIISSPTSAKDPNSLKLLNDSLLETKKYLDSKTDVNWSSYFYQYTNRLAHLYYLRVRNNIPAYLVFIYFIGDNTVDGPKTKDEWLGALQVVKKYLGLKKNHKLSKYIIDVFIDVKDIGL